MHLHAADGEQLLSAYGAALRPDSLLATLSAKSITRNDAPDVAGFSSRGPALTDNAALLKPDILAPGVNIFAAAPGTTAGSKSTGAFMSGTSMAAPHIAGIAAVIKTKHPR